jgi:hypothetical protein
MNRFARGITRSLLAVAATATLGTAFSGGAGADAVATAYNERSFYITNNPTSDMQPATSTRYIKLDAGNYDWYVGIWNGSTYWDGSYAFRRITLARGYYAWVCTLYPGVPSNGQYTDQCTLSVEGHSEAIVKSGGFTIPFSSDNYTMKGVLDPY